jgi:hypothetical protein
MLDKNDTVSRRDLAHGLRTILDEKKLHDGAESCLSKDQVLANVMKITERIGSGSVNGEAFRVCVPIRCNERVCHCTENPRFLALKKIPTSSVEYKLSKDPLSPAALSTELWAEILCMRLCNVLVDNKVTPNLPLYVSYFRCNSCTFVNEKLTKSSGNPCVLLVNELANAGDLKQWSKEPRSTAEWMNAYFQIFNALYALQKFFNLTHHDLHWGNVLVHKIPPGGFYRYRINGETYDVPNLGWLFVLWDFGYARIPGKVEIATRQEYYERPEQNPRLIVDYHRIASAPRWRATADDVMIPTSREVKKFVSSLNKMYLNGATLPVVLAAFVDFYPSRKENDSQIIDEFNFASKVTIEKDLEQFLVKKGSSMLSPMSRRPSAEEIRLQDNPDLQDDLVSNKKEMAEMMKFLTGLTLKDDLLHHVPKFEEHYLVPPPVENIPYPDLYVHSPTEATFRAMDSLTRTLKDFPEFVDDIFEKAVLVLDGKAKTFRVTRAEWARLIEWLKLVKVPQDAILELEKLLTLKEKKRPPSEKDIIDLYLEDSREDPDMYHTDDVQEGLDMRKKDHHGKYGNKRQKKILDRKRVKELADALTKKLQKFSSQWGTLMWTEEKRMAKLRDMLGFFIVSLRDIDPDVDINREEFANMDQDTMDSIFATLCTIPPEFSRLTEVDCSTFTMQNLRGKMLTLLRTINVLLHSQHGSSMLLEFFSGYEYEHGEIPP